MQRTPDMLRLLSLILILAAAMAIAVNSLSLAAQSAASGQVPGIAVNIAIQKKKVPLGQSPWANLAVENLTDHEITMAEPILHVAGEKGELPLKPEAEIITRRLQPRTPKLRTVVYVPWTIAAHDSSIHQYKLAHFFDLKDPGRYTIYMEVFDPSSHQSQRTKTVKFEMESPAR